MTNEEMEGKKKEPQKTSSLKKSSLRKGWLKDIPLMSPAGIILLTLGFIADLVGWIPLVGLTFKVIFFVALFAIARPSLKSLIVPVIIEEIPVINLFPTCIVKMFF